MAEERIVRVKLRALVTIAVFVLGVAALLALVEVARPVLVWVLIALFLAVALNPLVEWFQRHGIKQRGLAVGVTFLLVLGLAIAIGAAFIPTLVDQVAGFADKVPHYVDQITKGKGRFGFLETKYRLADKVHEAIDKAKKGGAAKALGHAGDHEERLGERRLRLLDGARARAAPARTVGASRSFDMDSPRGSGGRGSAAQ